MDAKNHEIILGDRERAERATGEEGGGGIGRREGEKRTKEPRLLDENVNVNATCVTRRESAEVLLEFEFLYNKFCRGLSRVSVVDIGVCVCDCRLLVLCAYMAQMTMNMNGPAEN